MYTSPSCPIPTAENLPKCGALTKDILERIKLKQIKANCSLLNVSRNFMEKRLIL